MRKNATFWLAIGVLSFVIVPFYAVDTSFWNFEWLFTSSDKITNISALRHIISFSTFYYVPVLAALLIGLVLTWWVKNDVTLAKSYMLLAIFSIVYLGIQAFFFDGNIHPIYDPNAEIFVYPVGLGVGGFLIISASLFLLTTGVSGLSSGRGDAFIIGIIGMIIALVMVFVFYPVSRILTQAFTSDAHTFDIAFFFGNLFGQDIWSLGCITGVSNCGVAWNSLFLAVMTGVGTTALGLAFALVMTRTNFKAKKLLRVLTIIPIITPPFVIGLALILLFGRAGIVTDYLNIFFDIEKTRWIYGFTGIYIAQLLSFTPIAFLVMIGVVEGVSPSMEEASQTLNATPWVTFRKVTLPLMRPGLANAFLIGFIESIADFGNPLILGGSYNVLSTDIYFAIVGSVASTSKAGILAIVLLFLTLSAFIIQRIWLGKKSYSTITGKGDSGKNAPLSPKLNIFCQTTCIGWAAFSLIVYSMILFGSFVKLWGYDHSFTFEHYTKTFGIDFSNGIDFVGIAWDSYFTTLTISGIAAPLTAVVGLATAYILVRQKFAFKNSFEFLTMLSFAIPGTVIGVSYIMAFNTPPIELTGTAVILVICFIFRNMPVGVRGGVAAMSQLDKSLDEASITLGANSFTTVRRVILPLMKPAILAALVYSFVRAITSVSAVIFLVGAEHNMATSFIVGRVEHGEFGVGIAYSTVLIITMLVVILFMQLFVGKRKIRSAN